VSLVARLATLERKQPPTPPEPADPAELRRTLRILCTCYALDGAEWLRDALAWNPNLMPDTADRLVRLAGMPVERKRRGEPLTADQAMILEGLE